MYLERHGAKKMHKEVQKQIKREWSKLKLNE